MRAKCTLPLALLLLAIAAPVAGAHAGTVKVRSVSAPRSATAGASTTVDVTVARKGRTRAAAVGFYLSANAKRDGQDVRLKGAAKVAKGRRSGTSRLGAELKIPDGQALGSYRVLACIGKSCAASKKALAVTKVPVGTAQLVNQAIAAGKLSPEQGLVYRAFAAFGDRRLPAAYAGDDTAHEDTVMREVAESWPKLSSAQRRQVEPFFTPPAARGAAASASAGTATGCHAGLPDQPVRPPRLAVGRERRRDGHVRIWWHSANQARFAARARAMLAEADDTIWRKLWPVFGRDPVTDEHENCFHGGDGKLDIYLVNRTNGTTKGETIPYPGPCSQAAPYIVFYAGAAAAHPLGAGPRAHPRVPVRVPAVVVLELRPLRRGGRDVGRPVRLPARRSRARVHLVHEGAEHAARRRLLRRMGVPLRARAHLRAGRYAEDLRAGRHSDGHARDRRRRAGRSREGLPGVRQARLEPRPREAELLGVGRLRPRARGRGRRDPPGAGGPGSRRAARGGPHAAAETALTRVQAPEVRAGHRAP